MSGLQPLERQWTILRTLAARRYGATVRELAEELGVSQKTIRRDLALLQDLGFPVSHRPGRHGRNHWFATLDATAPPLTFDIGEVLALYLGRSLLEPLAGTVFWDSIQSAFRKIKASLGEPGSGVLIEYPDDEDLLETAAFLLEADDPSTHKTLRAQTREGRPSVDVVFLHEITGQLIVKNERDKQIGVDLQDDSPPPLDLATTLVMNSASITRPNWFKHFTQDVEPPHSWPKSPILRFHRVAVLINGRYIHGNEVLRLDPDLGVVFEKLENSC